MSRGPDAATLLARALLAHAAQARCAIILETCDSTRWSSATFAGARHRVSLTAPARPALDAWLAALPEADLPMRGHLVADLAVHTGAVSGDTASVTIEALTVEER